MRLIGGLLLNSDSHLFFRVEDGLFFIALDGGGPRLSPRADNGSGADQAEQFMEAKRTPFTGVAGHRRAMERQGQR